ncbi:MAG TPA: T9SS type A sorting domain-containing protein [Saprospiraceae bacterium]|nr:T9SS type A sorting domain-containing protein [Saprospiraceae bacterium]
MTFTVTSDCDSPKSCSATFTVDPAPAVVLSCPANVTEVACQDQATIDSKFNAWKTTASFTGGCNGVLTNNSAAAPNHCGGTATVTFTVTSDCEAPKTCNATFTVDPAPAVVITCPANVTEAACQDQSVIDSKFNAWKTTASFTGGCNGVLTNNGASAPNHCGGTATVTFTVTSDCEAPKTCTATFTVNPAPAVVITCPANVTEVACQSQSTIDSKFTAWKATASFTGGCNGVLTNNNPAAPSACGGVATATFTVTSDCEAPKTCTATFTVTPAPAVVITCPAPVTEAACQTQSAIDGKFATWKTTASFTGGCNGVLTNSGGTAPDHCGGTTTVTFTVTSDCEAPKTCNATFTVTPAPPVVITCPANVTEAACQTQSAIDGKFATWKTTASFTGGCNGVLTNSGGTAPDHCGGTTTVTFTVTSDCEAPKTCNATFTVTPAPPVVITCPANVTEAACQTQSAIDSKFATWKTTASFTGGCNGALTNSGGTAPNHCGGTTTVTFTVTSDCEGPKTCNATFTVDPAPPVVITCPAPVTEAACQTQTAIDSKFAAWKTTASFTGGCNGVLTNSGGTAPNHCGGTTTITFTVTSDCEGPKTCNATFTVDPAPPVVITCPANQTEPACQSQSAIDTKFSNWKNSVFFTGGCNGNISTSAGAAPNHCGGSTTVTFTVTSDCDSPKSCSATFTVDPAPAVVLTCPANVTEVACQDQATIDSKFNAWKTTASFTGGCNGVLTNNSTAAPNHCGGTATVTFTVTSDCEAPKTCTATFTVNPAPAVAITCPANVTEVACQDQSVIDSKFNAWKTTASFTGGCNGVLTNNGASAPNHCGGTATVTFTVTSDCEAPKTCNATFTVNPAPAVVITCPANVTEVACQSQSTIDTKFNAWKTTASFTGGCNGVLTNNNPGSPSACGGVTTATFTVTSDCEAPKTCTATFSVLPPQAVAITCPANVTEAACQTQSSIDSKFATWKTTASFTGGCNASMTNSGGAAPNACGGTTSLTFTVTSDCEAPKTCTATFTVTPAPAVVLNCPANVTEAACQTQSAIDTKFAAWKSTASFSGGCNASMNNSGGTAPPACGGTTSITYTVTSTCEPDKTCTANFVVSPAPAVVMNCPANVTEAACQSQSAIDSKFTAWKATASFTGGCNGMLTNSGGTAPNHCGGTTSITFTVTSDCEPAKVCTATFTVDPAAAVILSCPANVTEAACQTQTAIDSKFAAWKTTASFTGGCNGALTNSGGTAPNACGGSTSITFTVTSDCEGPKTCTATFTVDPAPALVVTCPSNVTEAACQTQTTINSKFNTWLTGIVVSGGCNPVVTNNNSGAPNACGGAATVTFTVTSGCDVPKSCTSTFTVSPAPALVMTCPTNVTEISCQSQSVINSKYSTWLATATFTGGCNGVLTNNSPGAPNACGGSATVTFTVTSDCEPVKTCTAIFTVTAAPAVNMTCPGNVTEAACQTQSSIDSKFATWKNTASFTGGCNGVLTNSGGTAPSFCGGVTTITFTVTSDCEAPKTCTASFTVTPAPLVTLTCPTNTTEAACQTQATIDTKFAAWKNTATFSGGCNSAISNSGGTAPLACGGTTSVTYTVTSSCEPNKTCTASFTVTAAPAVVLNCPINTTEAACQTQGAIDSKFTAWKNTVTFSGGCNSTLSNSGGTAPPACGGSTSVTYTVASSCEPNKTCTASFTVTAAPAVVLNCPTNVTEAACQTQAAITSKFNTWLATANATGGCNTVLTNNNSGAPNACGGTATVIFTATSSCEAPKTCTANFIVSSPAPVSLTCPTTVVEGTCQTQASIDAKYATWLATVSATGGCNVVLSNNSTGAPNACGGSVTVVFTATSSCEAPKTCTSTFTVATAPPVILTCPANTTEAACQTQSAIDNKFSTWLTTVTVTGGCNTSVTNNNTGAPNACGGTTTVTFTVTSGCESPKTCNATFTVTTAPAVTLNCPVNVTEVSCQSQNVINSKYNTWLATFTSNGGCNVVLSNNSSGSPNACGEIKSVVFTATSSCENPKSCTATFTVSPAPVVVVNCPANVTEVACQTQTAITTKFNTWKNTAGFTGGCNGILTNNGNTTPNACGGTATVIFTVTSDCEPAKTCTATFAVAAAPAVVLNCPVNQTEAACQTQSVIDTKFNTWKNSATFSGGCNGVISNSGGSAPGFCGGTTSVTYTVISDCEAPKTCTATFTVTSAPPVVLNCPSNQTEAACQTQSAIDSKFNTWKNSVTFSGGCNATITNSVGNAPSYCGGSTSITYTVSSACEPPKTCTATFTVTNAPAVVLNCPANVTETACQTQSAIDSKFNTWLATASTSGGCSPVLTNNNAGAPAACGGVSNVVFTVTSGCEAPKTCTASFTVTSAPPVTLNCPVNQTEDACQTQASINTKFNTWLGSVSVSGGCGTVLTNNNTGAPAACGGSTTVTFTVTSTCESSKTCAATFTVLNAPAVIITCPNNVTEAACQAQSAIDAKFASWLATLSTSGGCNVVKTNNNTGAPNACGGATTVVFTASSDCESPKTCSATFTVTVAPQLVVNCPFGVTEAACQTQDSINSKYANWLSSITTTGGCNVNITNNSSGNPNACGEIKSVTFNITSSCEPPKNCVSTFAVNVPSTMVLNCPVDKTVTACFTQTEINDQYNTWLQSVTVTGGCNPVITNSSTGAPNSCGGSKTVTFTATSACTAPTTCNATFTVTILPPPSIICPAAKTIDCNASTLPTKTGFATGLDGCNSNPVITYTDVITPGSCNSNYSINRKWVATDKCGNTNSCTQIITVQDTFKPTFTVPADITIYRGLAPAGYQLLVNYDYNKGNSYKSLEPWLFSQITCKMDSSTVTFKRDSGVATGTNALATNSFAGKGLVSVDSRDTAYWHYKIAGNQLSSFYNYEVYVQGLRVSNGSAKTLLMDYSLNGINWINFNSTPMVKNVWTESRALIPNVSKVQKLYVRIRYKDANDSLTREFRIDNFQMRGYQDADGCAYDASPSKTGFPSNVLHPCDPNPTSTYSDSTILAPCVSSIFRTWTVTDDCGNVNTSAIKQVITIKDTTGPILTCPTGNLLSKKADTLKCFKTMDSLLDVKAIDACTLDSVTIKNNYNNTNTLKGEKIPVGVHSITWTATDQCGNTSTCKYLLNVYETEPPIAKCRDIVAYLDVSGKYKASVDSIDNGSTDNCAIKTRKLSRENYDCDDIPTRTVIYTVTDSSGLSDTCQALITFKDTVAPTIVCKNITITIPATGMKTITADSLLTSAYDACGIPVNGKKISKDTFTCRSPKVTSDTVTVTDKYGNKSKCISTVTISNADGDCDGVQDICDVCPKTDDTVDNDHDGKPDCNVIPLYANILAGWKCNQGGQQKVYISEIVNGVCTTKCVFYSTFKATRTNYQWLGPCIMCGGNLKKDPNQKDTLSQEVFISEGDGISSRPDFKIIPNPNYGTFEIVFDQPVEDGIIEIYNMLDEAVWKKKVNTPTDRIKLSENDFKQNASGIYWVVFKNEHNKVVRSLMITK